MDKMYSLIVCIVLLGSFGLKSVVGTSADSETCLLSLEDQLDGLAVPEEVKHIGDYLRSLNPSLAHLSLSVLISTPTAERDFIKAGFVPSDEMANLESVCTEFILELSELIDNSQCSPAINERGTLDVTSALGTHNKVGEIFGLAEACYSI